MALAKNLQTPMNCQKKELSIIRELSREFSFEEKATKVKIYCGHIVRGLQVQ